VLHGAQARLP